MLDWHIFFITINKTDEMNERLEKEEKNPPKIINIISMQTISAQYGIRANWNPFHLIGMKVKEGRTAKEKEEVSFVTNMLTSE